MSPCYLLSLATKQVVLQCVGSLSLLDLCLWPIKKLAAQPPLIGNWIALFFQIFILFLQTRNHFLRRYFLQSGCISHRRKNTRFFWKVSRSHMHIETLSKLQTDWVINPVFPIAVCWWQTPNQLFYEILSDKMWQTIVVLCLHITLILFPSASPSLHSSIHTPSLRGRASVLTAVAVHTVMVRSVAPSGRVELCGHI